MADPVKKGVVDRAIETIVDLKNSFTRSASPDQPAVATAPSGPSPESCAKLSAEIDSRGGSVKAGQERMAISCGLGGT